MVLQTFVKNTQGYIIIRKPNHPFAHSNKYVKRSRLIMEQHLGRYLKSTEIIHHINRNITDDRIENLSLLKQREHSQIHNKATRRCSYCGRLIKKNNFCHSENKVNRHSELYGKSIKELMVEFKLSRATIWRRLNKNIPLNEPKKTHCKLR